MGALPTTKEQPASFSTRKGGGSSYSKGTDSRIKQLHLQQSGILKAPQDKIPTKLTRNTTMENRKQQLQYQAQI